MRMEIKLKELDFCSLIPQEEPSEGKRWSFSYVYFLEDLRNIYRVYDENKIDTIASLSNICSEIDLKSQSGKKWTNRSLLELVNALKNFKLLDIENKVIKSGLFSNTLPDEPLSSEEVDFFKAIYFSYFRFVEFHRLMLGCDNINVASMENLSMPLIAYMQDTRFTNRFIVSRESQLKIAGIPDEHSDMMRFWDVYVKWGVALNLLKKYPLKPFGISTTPSVKGLSIVYFCREMPRDFSVFDYVTNEIQGSYIFIPDIIYSIIQNKRYTAEDIIDKLVEESTTKSDIYRAQSTSAIFITDKENFLFPKIGNTYITHLLKL